MEIIAALKTDLEETFKIGRRVLSSKEVAAYFDEYPKLKAMIENLGIALL
jgi:hypothetical protein